MVYLSLLGQYFAVKRSRQVAVYTVERHSTNDQSVLRSRHNTLIEARSAFDAAVKWYINQQVKHPVAWCNLVARDTMHRERYLSHWEQSIKETIS
jgi:hypothetical protein